MTLSSNQPVDPILALCVQALLGKKPVDPVVLDLRELTSVADAFVICHGLSSRQVTAIGESVQRSLKKKGVRPLSVEGLKDGHWVLLDYGHVIVHVFYESTRSLYDLEGLWADAGRMDIAILSGFDAGGNGVSNE